MPIRLLMPEVASQIAAGEVIERPASVVKELVENALDAGASAVSINVRDAGRTLIEVVDDGSGIAGDELHLAVERHATSKLSRAEELFRIATLGFRGEALSSIASVSRLTLSSRRAADREGLQLQVEGGKSARPATAGLPVGTAVRVEELFFNVPARLKFLKTDTTERRAIDGWVTRYALAYPHVRFKLTQDGRAVLQTAGDGDQRAVLAALYGVDIARQMLEVLAEDNGLRLTGFISPTSVTRSNRKEITFFVNGRWTQDAPLTTALVQAYHTLLMVGRYPLAALFLTADPEDVDVNVHPAKAEVRFRNADKVFAFVQRSVRKALMAYSPVPSIAPAVWGGQARAIDPAWEIAHDEGLGVDSERLTEGAAAGPATLDREPQNMLHSVPLLRLIGQIGATYLVAEGPDGLYLVDQHAAHERVLFEKLMAQYESQSVPSQALLSPEVVHLPPAQARLLEGKLDVLKKFGFEVESFGQDSFQVRSMPALFNGSDAAAALRGVVEDFEEDETPLQSELEARLAGRVCKRLAVRAGQVLAPEAQQALLSDLEACQSPRTCPHGRPTMIHLSVEMLERQFGRRGAR